MSRIEDLEAQARIPLEQQVATQETRTPRTYLDPEDLDRLRLLADPAGPGRLDPRA